MKKILYILICLPLIFSSCKKEDDSPNSGSSGSTNNTSASIIGTWESTSSTQTSTSGYLDPIQGTEIITSTETTSTNYPTIDGAWSIWTFASNGDFTVAQYENDTLSNLSVDFSYVKDGNTITIDIEGDDFDFTITTLTNSTLSINWSDYGHGPSSNDTTFFYNNTGSSTFNKSNKKINSSIQSQNKTSQTPFFKQFIDRRKNK
jgi:hypothetical protein